MGFQQEAKRSHLVRPPAVLDGVVRLYSSEFWGSGFRGLRVLTLRGLGKQRANPKKLLDTPQMARRYGGQVRP